MRPEKHTRVNLYSSDDVFRIKSDIKLSEQSFQRLLSGDILITKIWFPVQPKTKLVFVYARVVINHIKLLADNSSDKESV